MAVACFLGIEVLFLAAAHFFGGPSWTLLGMLAFFAQIAAAFRVGPLAMLMPSLAWPAVFHATGNRELFFPYAMHLATHVALLLTSRSPWLGAAGGGIMVAAFMVIRIVQAATPKVLAVEFVVTVAIIGLALAARAWGWRSPLATGAIIVLSSLAAFASLAL